MKIEENFKWFQKNKEALKEQSYQAAVIERKKEIILNIREIEKFLSEAERKKQTLNNLKQDLDLIKKEIENLSQDCKHLVVEEEDYRYKGHLKCLICEEKFVDYKYRDNFVQ